MRLNELTIQCMFLGIFAILAAALIGVSLVAYLLFDSLLLPILAFALVIFVGISGWMNKIQNAWIFRLREERRMKPLIRSAKNLEAGLSAFGSGNLVTKVDYEGPKTTDSSSFNELRNSLQGSIEELNQITDESSKRLCFSGSNSYQEGQLLGKRIVDILHGKGKIAFLIPALTQVNHALRVKGTRNYLFESRSSIEVVSTIETLGNNQQCVEATRELLRSNPHLDIICMTDGYTPQFVGQFLADLRSKGERVPSIVAYDLIVENVKLLKDGIIHSIVEQNMYAQAYNSIVLLWNALESNWKPISKKLFQTSQIVDRNSLSQFWDERLEARKLTVHERELLVQVVPRRSQKKYRLAILLPHSSGFAQGLSDGAIAAQNDLKPLGVEVEIFNTLETQDWMNFGNVVLFGPYIQRLRREGYHGFATTVFDSKINFEINLAVDEGLIVTTYNSEPSNFRELIGNVSDNMQQLTVESQSLAASAEESSRAHQQISNSILAINTLIKEQKEKISWNDRQLIELSSKLESAMTSVKHYQTQVLSVLETAGKGAQIVEQSNVSSKSSLLGIERIQNAVRDFTQKFSQISTMVTTIRSFAEETNVLAINAAIQATRAGDSGKGFQVVSGEVRKLAENSKYAALQIAEQIEAIERGLEEIRQAGNANKTLFERNVELSQSARDAFQEIEVQIRATANEIHSISDTIVLITQTGHDVRTNMDSIDEIAQNSVMRMQEIADTSQELEKEGHELLLTANHLQTMADSQKILFSQLTLNETE